MQKIKFSKDTGSIFYKELKEQVEAYFLSNHISKTGNRQMLFKIVLYFGLDIILYTVMITSSSLLGFYFFYILMGISILLTAFNISHDAAHGVAVKNKFWNKLLFQISFNLQGSNAYVWGKNHTESHHLYTNIEGSDIDVLNNPLLRMTETQALKPFHKYQYIYSPLLYLFYSLNWLLFRDTLLLFNFTSRTIQIKIPRNEIIKLILYKVLYLLYMLIIPMYVLSFSWNAVLLIFIINHFIISIFFTSVLGVAHLSDFVSHPTANEDGKLPMSWAKLQLITSVDFNADSRFLNWTLGGFNAHTLHHLLPDVCHVHYLKLLPIFRELIKKHQLDYMEMTYTEAVKSHYRFLKGMGIGTHLNRRIYAK